MDRGLENMREDCKKWGGGGGAVAEDVTAEKEG